MDSAIETSERISRCIAGSPADIGGRHLKVEVTVGVTGILCGDSAEDVLDRAAGNMEFAKSDG